MQSEPGPAPPRPADDRSLKDRRVTGTTQVSAGLVHKLVLVIPAFVANAVFWGLIGINHYFQMLRIVEPKDMLYLLIPVAVVPLVGLIYGIAIGSYLSARSSSGTSWYWHPGLQALFQSFWFMVMITAGCICSVPIGLVVETVSFLADQK